MTGNLTQFLERWLSRGGSRIGQVSIRPWSNGWSLTHITDRAGEPPVPPQSELEIFTKPEAARGIALKDDAGNYRPLKTAPNLRRGWELRLPDVPAVRLALDFLYPAALGNWIAWLEEAVPRQTLRDMLNRQTGMYRVTGLARDDEAQAAVAETCELHTKCFRKIVWPLDEAHAVTSLPLEKFTVPAGPEGDVPEIPILCTDACPLLIGALRETVSRRRKAEREAAAADSPPAPAPSASDSVSVSDSSPVSASHSHA